jgi:hypothetical protein
MSQIVACNRRISQRALQLLAVAVLALVACSLAMAPTARAGEWVQRSCSYGTEYIFPEGWEGKEVDGFQNRNEDQPFDGCLALNQGGGLDVVADGEEGNQAGAGEIWLYKAPHDSTIAGGVLTAKLTVNNGDAVIITGPATLANCESPNCHNSGGLVPITAGGKELYEEASCFGSDEGHCPRESNFAATASINSAQIVLATNAIPAASGFSGTLLNNTVTGKGNLSFTATDAGPGVYQAKAQIDGQQVWAETPSLNENKCLVTGIDEGARAFNYAQPCPAKTAVNAEIDTTSLADGSHKLTVEVENAAGNTAVVYEHTITIANHPVQTPGSPIAETLPGQTPIGTPPALLSPAPVRGPANGTPASESAVLTAHWQGAPSVSASASTSTSTSLKSAYGRSHEITGRLTTTAGGPIADALIEVTQKPASLGAIASSITGAHTDSQGKFIIDIPPSSSSTSIRLVYRAHLGDATPAATQTLTLRVPASIQLTVSPHLTSIGHTIVLSGKLAGPIPPGGKKVLFEARVPGGSWIEFHNATVDAQGRFRATHRFTFSGPLHYQFRVVCEREADFPFLPGTSNIVRVRER